MGVAIAPLQAFWLSMILVGCFFNGVVLELIVKYVLSSDSMCPAYSHLFIDPIWNLTRVVARKCREDPGAGGLMTFVQFIFVSILYLPKFLSFRNPETGAFRISLFHRTPWRDYLAMTLVFFVCSVSSNKAFALGVSQPFAVIFRSLSLLVSYLIGMLWFGKRYSLKQFIAIFFVTMGVLITTFGELYLKSGLAQRLDKCCSEQPYLSQAYMVLTNHPSIGFSKTQTSDGDSSVVYQLLIFMFTLFLLSLTLIGLAVLGHLQGKAYKQYKPEPEENMYYLHLLPLPMFITLLPDLKAHYLLWNASQPYDLFGLTTIPWLWFLCIFNAITQVICLLGVHNTTSLMGTLVCTFATTVRKFISLIFSVLYFQSPFTPAHYLGSACVFFGTYLFATAPNVEAPPESHEKKD